MLDLHFDAQRWPGLFYNQDPRQGRQLFLPAELQALQAALQREISTGSRYGPELIGTFENWQSEAISADLHRDQAHQALDAFDQNPQSVFLINLLYSVCLSAREAADTDWQALWLQNEAIPRLARQTSQLSQQIEQLYQQGLADTKWHFLPFVLDAGVLGPKTLKVKGSQISDPAPPIQQTPLPLPDLHWLSWNPITLILNRRYLRVLRQAEARFGSLDAFFKLFSALSVSLVFNYMVNLVRQSSPQPLDHRVVQNWKLAFDAVFASDYTQHDQPEIQAGYLSGQFLIAVDCALDLLVAASSGLEQDAL